MKNLLTISLISVSILFSCKKEEDVEPDTVIINKIQTENVTITTQTELDEFTNLNYEQVDGDLIIDSKTVDPIINLDGLNNLNYINGNLSLLNLNELSDLSTFNSIDSIDGNLNIKNNITLESISGFNKLSKVGGLWVVENELLTNLNGLSNLTSIETDAYITQSGINDLSGLQSLESVGNNLSIYDLQITNLSSFPSLYSVGQYLYISDNSELISIDGFSNLKEVNGFKIQIAENPKLNSIDGFAALEKAGAIEIITNDELTTISGFNGNLEILGPFNSLSQGDIEIRNNKSLESISGFKNLTTVSRSLFIYNNENLNTISGFTNLNFKISNFHIYENNIESITGFNSLTEIGNLYIRESTLVEACWLKTAVTNMNSSDPFTFEYIGGTLDQNGIIALCN